MPLYLEPNRRFPIVLDIDKDKPEDSRPTFWALSQAMRGQELIAETLDLYTDNAAITPKQLFDKTIETLTGVVVAWEHMGGHEFSPEAMRAILNYSEARELLRKVMYNQHLTHEEKKS